MKSSNNRHNLVKTGIVVLAAIAPAIVTASGITPTTPATAVPTTTQSCTLPPPPVGATAVLVDDLEDGDSFNQFRGTWFTYDDRDVGGDSYIIYKNGNSAFKASSGGPNGSLFAARIQGVVTNTYPYGFLGMGTNLHNSNCAVDITQYYNGIKFWAKGDGKRYRLKLRSPVTGDDGFGYNFVADTQWKEYDVKFGQLQQGGPGPGADLNDALRQVISINWQTVDQPHGSIELIVDNIRFTQ
ncbi:MAG: CIA30 family protein [Hormoscilla sp.]